MSFRYGVELIPDPSFVAQAHQARKLICDQYASWAAEMFMVHVTVADFFECPNPAVEKVRAGLTKIAAQSRMSDAQFSLSHNGAATFLNDVGEEVPGTIILNFDELLILQQSQVGHIGIPDVIQIWDYPVMCSQFLKQVYDASVKGMERC